jgi:hypothetical protein
MTKIQEAPKKVVYVKEKAQYVAIKKEVVQIFKELKALMPVFKHDILEDAELLRCFLSF